MKSINSRIKSYFIQYLDRIKKKLTELVITFYSLSNRTDKQMISPNGIKVHLAGLCRSIHLQVQTLHCSHPTKFLRF